MNFLIKRIFDIVLSGLALIILLPIFAIIAIAIKIDSKGSALFKQGRLTKNGKVFTMYKFRTMIENAENMGTGLFNYENDFRVTTVGKFLRRSSLDELPQLFNVLIGDMSLVGPRPPVTYELGNYNELNDEYKHRFTVLPGITGLAQISGRNELPWDIKVKYDNEYIEKFNKYCIFFDIKILFLTALNSFAMRDIYEVPDEAFANLTDEELTAKASEAIISKARLTEAEENITS